MHSEVGHLFAHDDRPIEGFGGRGGFGRRPALTVVDVPLASPIPSLPGPLVREGSEKGVLDAQAPDLLVPEGEHVLPTEAYRPEERPRPAF